MFPFKRLRPFLSQDLEPSLFVFATRIEIPGWRCDQLSESAHAGSDQEIGESCQQVLPILMIPPTCTCKDVWYGVCCIALRHPTMGIRGGALVVATPPPPHCLPKLSGQRADQATHKHRCQIIRLLLLVSDCQTHYCVGSSDLVTGSHKTHKHRSGIIRHIRV